MEENDGDEIDEINDENSLDEAADHDSDLRRSHYLAMCRNSAAESKRLMYLSQIQQL